METRSKAKTRVDHHVESVVSDLQPSTSGHQMTSSGFQAQLTNVHRSSTLGNRSLSPRTAGDRIDAEQAQQSDSRSSTNLCSKTVVSVHSKNSQHVSHHSGSSHSSATIRAMRLEAEADLVRRRAERARQLAESERQRERGLAERERERQSELLRLEDEADELAMQAKLAACDASVKSFSRNSSHTRSDHRTSSWVLEQNKHRVDKVQFQRDTCNSIPLITTEAPLLLPPTVISEPLRDPPVRPADCNTAFVNDYFPTGTSVNPPAVLPTVISTRQTSPQDPIQQLTKAITALSDRPKKPELCTFSGDVTQWMAFKSSYDRTKHLYSSAENMTRLSLAVRGTAYQTIASLLWVSQDPEEVLRTLEQSFARPEILVAHEIAGLRNIPKISSPEQINTLANKIRNCVTTIKLLGQYEYLYSPELFRAVLLKLSEHVRSRFADYAADNMPLEQNMSKIEMLSKFLLHEADRQLKYNFTLEIATTSTMQQKASNIRRGKDMIHSATTLVSSSTTSPTPPTAPCCYCKQGPHSIKSCKAFQLLSVNDRWQWIRKAKVCYRCLKNNPHKWNNCRAKLCSTNGCTRRHHALLHGNSQLSNSAESSSHPSHQINSVTSDETLTDSNVGNSINNEVSKQSQTLINLTGVIPSLSRPRGLLKLLPVVVEGPNGSFNTTALLDEGSTVTLIDGDVALKIGAKSLPPRNSFSLLA